MITRTHFKTIDDEIKNALIATLSNMREQAPSQYILFLADGEYSNNLDVPHSNLSPYTIDNRLDIYADESRLLFLSKFLNAYYPFPSTQMRNEDDEYRMHLELMTYSHIWESKPFLKKLYRLAKLAEGTDYPWKVVIPDMSKHTFIRNEIRESFDRISNNLSEIIRNGFHTSLRNAFAHSEYSFNTMNNKNSIELLNYKGDTKWELQYISFDAWSVRFVYSALLSYHLYSYTASCRKSLVEDMRNDKFTIPHPGKTGNITIRQIRYHRDRDSFSFE